MMGYLVEGGRLTDLACWLVIVVLTVVGLAVASRIKDDDVRELLKECKKITKDAAKHT